MGAVTIEITVDGPPTTALTQDNNDDEQAREHSEQNWQMMLDGLKQVVEKER